MLPAEPDKVRKDDTPRAVMALNGELRIQLVYTTCVRLRRAASIGLCN